MNTLSILLYLIEFLSGVNIFASIYLFGSIMVFAIWSAVLAVIHDDNLDQYGARSTPEKHAKAQEFFDKKKYLPSRFFVATLFVAVFLTVIIPSKQTMYLIAASELGEVAINTPEAEAIYNDIRSVIRGFIPENTND